MTPYKYLSIRQPWARFITTGIKPVENREWKYPPTYRGPLFIHAGKKMTKRDLEDAIRFARGQGFDFDEADIREAARTRRMGIVGIANVTGAVRHPDFYEGHGMAKGFALAGYIGIQLADARALPFVSMRGFLGIKPLAEAYLGKEHRRAWAELTQLHRKREAAK